METLDACASPSGTRPRRRVPPTRASSLNVHVHPDLTADQLAGVLDAATASWEQQVYWADRPQTWYGSMSQPRTRCTPTVLAVSNTTATVVNIPFVQMWPGRYTDYNDPIFGTDYLGVAQSTGCISGQAVPSLPSCDMLFVYWEPSTPPLTVLSTAADTAETLGSPR